ncbi:hypothetical protein, partial [Enterobacter sp. PTB]
YHRRIEGASTDVVAGALTVLPEWPSNKVAELLPWNVALTNK